MRHELPPHGLIALALLEGVARAVAVLEERQRSAGELAGIAVSSFAYSTIMIYSIALLVDYIVTRPAAFRKGYSPHTFCTPVHKLDSGQAAFAASVTQTKRPPVSGEPAGVFLVGELLVYRVPDDGVGVENSEIPNFLRHRSFSSYLSCSGRCVWAAFSR